MNAFAKTWWRRATPEQQKRFLTHFHALALRSYATVLNANTDIPIEYLPMREESRENFATVRTVINLAGGGGQEIRTRRPHQGFEAEEHGSWRLAPRCRATRYRNKRERELKGDT